MARRSEIALERGALVLQSRPSEAEREFAFAGLSDLFDDVLEHVLRTLSPPRRRALEVALLLEEASEPADPRALGVAVRTGIELLAAEQQLVLAVDDVQWLDGSSVDALAFALRRTSAPLTVLLSRRLIEHTDASPLEHAIASASLERLRIGPLSIGALQTVLRERLDRVFPRPTLLRVHETSGGNPFYALVLARALPMNLDPTEPLPIPKRRDLLDHAARMRRVYDLINAGDIDRFGEHIAEDFVENEETPGLEPTKEGVKQFFHMYKAAFPDLRMDAQDIIVSGDKAVARVRATGTHQGELLGMSATGRSVDVQLIDIIRFGDDGRAREHWGVVDALAMMQQLGAIPEPPGA